MSAKAIITGIIALMLMGCPYSGHAQRPTKDKEKARQWQSMENGPWDFAPDWYYFLLHKKYSGAEMYWKWAGFQSGFRVRFKEHKSNVKRIMPTRVTAEETQRQKIKKVEEVLVYNPKTQEITTDIWIDFGNGIGFEDTYEDTVFWMSYPKPPKEMEE